MAPDLSRPRRTSPLAALFWLFRGEQLRTVLPVVFVAASSGRFVLVLAAGLAVGGILGTLTWWRRTWSFRDGVLHLDEGVLTRNQRRIPVERIQHVELERRLRHQVFDLAAVRVETAGGGGAELTLDAITLAEADALRTTVLDRLRADGPGDTGTTGADGSDGTVAAAPPEEVLVRLPPSRLLLAGITGPEVLAVLAAIGFALDTLADLGVEPGELDGPDLSGLLVAALVLVAVPAWFGVAAVIGLVRRWDLTVLVAGDELRVRYGLLRRNEFVVKTSRVQDVRVSHRLLLRPFGRADVRVRTAASGSTERSRVDIPLLDATEIDVVLARVLPAAVPLPALAPAPAAARRRALLRGWMAGAALLALAILLALASSAPAVGALGFLGLAAAIGMGEASYRGLGQARTAGMVHSRWGALTRRHTVVPEARVQSASVVATWFQRRRHLATLRLDLAGTAVPVFDRDLDEARHLQRATVR